MKMDGSIALRLHKMALPWRERARPQALFRLPMAGGARVIALTICDGPSPHTHKFLQVLEKHGARASFFVRTGQIAHERGAAIARDIAEGGHDLAHELTHDALAARLSGDQFHASFARAHGFLVPYGSAHQRFFRPNRHSFSPRKMDPTLKDFGYDRPLASLGSERRYVLSSLPGFTPRHSHLGDPAALTREARRFGETTAELAFPGAILAFQDNEDGGGALRIEAECAALDGFLAGAAARGFTVTSLSEGIARCAPRDLAARRPIDFGAAGPLEPEKARRPKGAVSITA